MRITIGILCSLILTTLISSADRQAAADIVTIQAGLGGQSSEIIQEAMLVQENDDENYGGRSDFELGVVAAGRVRTTVMRFDVSDPMLGLYTAGGVPLFSSIDAVTLTLTTTGNSSSSNNMDIRVGLGVESQGDWVEGTHVNPAGEPDTGLVTYSERREAQGTDWLPNTNYHRGGGAGIIGTATSYPGVNTSFDIDINPLSGEELDDIFDRWVTGENEGILLNDFNRTGFARWFMHSSESNNQAARPMLTVEFTPIPEPNSIVLVLCGATVMFGYRGWRKYSNEG